MLDESKRIKTKKQLNEWLSYELNEKYGGSSPIDFLMLSESAVLKQHIKYLRKTEYYTNTHKKILSKLYLLLLYKIQNKYGMHIQLNCCSKGLKVMHTGPIIMNENAIIGENCSIHVNSGIVAAGTSNKAPVVGNNVVIGLGAVLLGDIEIADYIAVGANAVVSKSFYDQNIAIAGVPAKKVSDNGTLNWKKED